MQHDILDGMGRAEILALAVGGADEVFLVLRKVGSAALIHFAAALCTIQKPGEHTHFTHLGRPYGYMKSPEDKKKWIVDEEAAAVVQKIFSLCVFSMLLCRSLCDASYTPPQMPPSSE